MQFLHAYTFSSEKVLAERFRKRDAALDGLKAVAGRLERAGLAMQMILNKDWWNQANFAEFLEERCKFDFQAISSTGVEIRGHAVPDFALLLPNILQDYSTSLIRFRNDLKKKLSARRITKTFYLAKFAIYIKGLTGKPAPWGELAELVNAARPETWEEKQVEASLIRRNFESFTVQHKEVYEQLCADIGAYLSACAQLSEKDRPTLDRWLAIHRAAGKQPS